MGGRIVGRWLTYTQNTLKIGKVTAFGPLHFRIWGGESPPKFVTGGTRPPPSLRFRRPWVERSGKKVGTTRNLSATFLYRLCLGAKEYRQPGTEKRVIHMCRAQFCTLVHDFLLKLLSQGKKLFLCLFKKHVCQRCAQLKPVFAS